MSRLLSALGLYSFCLYLGSSLAQVAGLYTLQDAYEGPSFLDGFDFFTQSDPTHGFVHYVDASTAYNTGLIKTTANSTYIGVDHKNSYPIASNGRPSVRIQSKRTYTYGLFVADISHMPGGACGTWPAFWTFGPKWPNGGEIDIIEGVNQATNNLMSLHTSSNCTIAGSGETGTLITNNCFVNAAGQPGNSGCGVTSADTSSYGTAFNTQGGGVYAMEWTSKAIKIWFFPRDMIPASIKSGSPSPTTFGTPAANFQGSCNIDSHFGKHQITFDTTFCGDFAGNVWASGSCATRAKTCVEYVAGNPSAFGDTFWLINSLRVYQLAAATPSSTYSTLSSVTPLGSTSSIWSLSSAVVGMGRASENSTGSSHPSTSGKVYTASRPGLSPVSSPAAPLSEPNVSSSPPLSVSRSGTAQSTAVMTTTPSGGSGSSNRSLNVTSILAPTESRPDVKAIMAVQTSTIRLCRPRHRNKKRHASYI